MASIRVAKRYAKSLLILAKEEGKLEEVYHDMEAVFKTCHENRDLIAFIKSPVVREEKKAKVLQKIFESHLSKISMNFIRLIARKGREDHLPDIAREVIQQYKTGKNIYTAIIKSAVPLDKNIKEKILGIMEKGPGSSIELEEEIDEGLIGGFVLKIGDKQLDSSIKHQLNELEQTLKN